MTAALINRIPLPAAVELGYLQLVYVPRVVNVEEIDLFSAHVDQHLRTGGIERYVSCRQLKVGNAGVLHSQVSGCVILNTVGVDRLPSRLL